MRAMQEMAETDSQNKEFNSLLLISIMSRWLLIRHLAFFVVVYLLLIWKELGKGFAMIIKKINSSGIYSLAKVLLESLSFFPFS